MPDASQASRAVPPRRMRRLDVGTPSPAYFGMVMATGIVSLAMLEAGPRRAAWGLFAIAVAAFAVVWALTILRLLRHPGRVEADLIDHLRGPVFFLVLAFRQLDLLIAFAGP